MFIETKVEFEQRHAKDGRPIRLPRGVWLFPDGARIAHNAMGADFLREPPDSPMARLGLQRQYHEHQLGYAEHDFTRLKLALLGEGPMFNWPQSRYGEPVSQDGKAALNFLKGLVEHHRAELAKIAAELDGLPEMVAARRRREIGEAAAVESRGRRLVEQSEISAIEI